MSLLVKPKHINSSSCCSRHPSESTALVQNCLGWRLLKNLGEDQFTFWTAPSRLETKQLRPAFTFFGVTGGLIASDHWFSKQVPDKANRLKQSQDFSNYALYSSIGAAGGGYLWGLATHNDHMRETGFLATEAFANATAVTYAFKAITERERPLEGDGHGHFFSGGRSFPSEHAAAAWSI